MNSKSVLILAAVAAVVVVAAIFAARGNRAEAPSAPPESKPYILADVRAKLGSVGAITVKHGDKEFTVRKAGETWEVAEKGGYPAKADDVKKVLFQLGELREGEEKTSKPELYSKLNVQDPDGKPLPEGAQGPTLLTLKDDKGAEVTSVIVGDVKYSPQGVFVRRVGQAKSWLASGQLEVPSEALRWLDTTIFQIARERLKAATVTHPDGETLRVSRSSPSDQNFAVASVPTGKELKYAGVGDGLGQALTYLNFEDVAPADQIDFEGKNGGKPGAYSEFRTFDGLMIAAQLTEKDGKTWVRFSAYSEATPTPPAAPAVPATPETKPPEAATGATGAPAATGATAPATATGATGTTGATAEAPKPAAGQKSAEEVKKEADEINAKVGRWAYQLPSYKVTNFNSRMADMLKSETPPPPPEGIQPLVPGPEGAPAVLPTKPK